MKVKVGNIVYDSEKEPVMVILTEQDKKNIHNMSKDATRYCMYPETWGESKILGWMEDVSEFDSLKKLLLEDERIQRDLELLLSGSFGAVPILPVHGSLITNEEEYAEELRHQYLEEKSAGSFYQKMKDFLD